MTFKRFQSMLRSSGRVPELLRCLGNSSRPWTEICAYLQIKQPEYPYSYLTPHGKTITLNDWEDLTTAWVIWYGNEYRIRQTDEYIVDAGANIGLFSLFANKHAPKARIVALEPFPTTFERLEQGVQQNGLAETVTTLQAALSSSAGVVYMDASEGIPGHSRKTLERSEGVSEHHIEVPCLDIRDCMERLGSDHVDFLKVDIEGAEYPFILGTDAADLQRCRRIGLEYHGNGDTREIFQKLQAAGFHISYYPKKGPSGVVEFSQ